MTTMGPRALLAGLAAAVLSSCGGTDGVQLDPDIIVGNVYTDCNLNTSYLWVSLVQDGIPSLDNPQWDQAELEIPEYLEPDTRIIGIEVTGAPSEEISPSDSTFTVLTRPVQPLTPSRLSLYPGMISSTRPVTSLEADGSLA